MNAAVDARPGVKTDLAILGSLAFILLAWRFWLIPQLGITLYVDEAQYWTWSQEMAWGFFSKPPGIAALIWLSTALFGDGILGVKALAMFCYPATAFVCWAIAQRLYDTRIAFWSAVTVLTLPMFSWLGLFVSTDALLTLLWSLALWAYLRALADNCQSNWLLLGLIGGFGLLSKYTMAACLLAIFLHLLAFHRPLLKSKNPWLAAGLALLLLSPNIFWNVTHDFPTLKHTADITVNKVAGGGFRQLGEFWAAQWIALGPILGSVLFWLFIRVDRSWRDERTRLLLWFALPLWLIVSAQAMNSGANANWAAPAFAPAAIAIVASLLQGKHLRWLIGALIFNLLLVGLVYHWPMLLAAVNVENPAKKSPYSRASGWDELGRQLAPIVAAQPQAILLADNRTLLAHMRYELRALQPQAISWNPEGKAGDHYKLTTDLRPHLGRDMLFISRDPVGEEITRCFSESRLLAELKAPLDRQTTLDMKVYWLHDFKGY